MRHNNSFLLNTGALGKWEPSLVSLSSAGEELSQLRRRRNQTSEWLKLINECHYLLSVTDPVCVLLIELVNHLLRVIWLYSTRQNWMQPILYACLVCRCLSSAFTHAIRFPVSFLLTNYLEIFTFSKTKDRITTKLHVSIAYESSEACVGDEYLWAWHRDSSRGFCRSGMANIQKKDWRTKIMPRITVWFLRALKIRASHGLFKEDGRTGVYRVSIPDKITANLVVWYPKIPSVFDIWSYFYFNPWLLSTSFTAQKAHSWSFVVFLSGKLSKNGTRWNSTPGFYATHTEIRFYS